MPRLVGYWCVARVVRRPRPWPRRCAAGVGSVGVADAQADDVDAGRAPGGDLALDLGEQVGRQALHAALGRGAARKVSVTSGAPGTRGTGRRGRSLRRARSCARASRRPTSTTSLPPGSSTVTGLSQRRCAPGRRPWRWRRCRRPGSPPPPAPRRGSWRRGRRSAPTNSTLALRGKYWCSSITGPTSCSGTSSSGQGELDDGVRVADVDEGELEAAPGGVQRLVDGVAVEVGELLAAEPGDAHVDAHAVAVARGRGTISPAPVSSTTRSPVMEPSILQLAGDHAHAVAAHLGFAAVGVEDAQPEAVGARGAGRRRRMPSEPMPKSRSHSSRTRSG